MSDSLLLEGYLPPLTSLTENTQEEELLENPVFDNHESVNLLGFHTSDFIPTINYDACLHDAIKESCLSTVKAEETELEILETLSLNSRLTDYNTPLLNGTLQGAFSPEWRNHDFFNLDANGFDRINITSPALEASAQAYHFKADPTSGLYLDIGYGNSTFIFTYDSDVESLTSDHFGVTEDSSLDDSNHGCKDYQSSNSLTAELLVDVFHHDHTYCQITKLSSVSEHYLTKLEKSTKGTSRTVNINKRRRCDEFLVKALKIPFSVSDIVTLPIDSFNSMLSKHYLTDSQLSLLRDIRRRGKNKAAAQNCRKRKLDTIINLTDDLYHLQAQKERLKKEKAQFNRSISNMKQKLDDLCLEVFGRLRDVQEKCITPSWYTTALQQWQYLAEPVKATSWSIRN